MGSNLHMNEEPVQFMLVAAHTGLDLFSIEFQPYIMGDDTLLCGLLTALSRFSNEMLSQSLESIKIGEHTMLIRVELPFLFCYVFKGQIEHANRRLDEFLRVIRNEKYLWKSLTNTISTGAVNKNDIGQIKSIMNHIISRDLGCIIEESWRGCKFLGTQLVNREQTFTSNLGSTDEIGESSK